MGNTYLMHYAKGSESKNHKYVSRKKGKNGRWVYFYGDNGHSAKKDKMTVQGDDEVDINTADDYLELIKEYGIGWGNGKRIGYGDIEDIEMYPVKNKSGVISYNMKITTKDGEKRTLKLGVKDGEDATAKAHREAQKIRKETEEQLGGKYNRKTHQVRKYGGSKRYLGNTTRAYRKTRSGGSGVKLKKPSIFATHSDEYTEELYHYAKGGESKNHKYVSRHKGKNGQWIYEYADDHVASGKMKPTGAAVALREKNGKLTDEYDNSLPYSQYELVDKNPEKAVEEYKAEKNNKPSTSSTSRPSAFDAKYIDKRIDKGDLSGSYNKPTITSEMISKSKKEKSKKNKLASNVKNRRRKTVYAAKHSDLDNMYLAHSSKGSHWKKHKYVSIVNGKYIYNKKEANAARAKDNLDRSIAERNRAEVQYRKDAYNDKRNADAQERSPLSSKANLEEANKRVEKSKKIYEKEQKRYDNSFSGRIAKLKKHLSKYSKLKTSALKDVAARDSWKPKTKNKAEEYYKKNKQKRIDYLKKGSVKA